MEEIGNTEAIQKEILDEARKTAERIIREADDEVSGTAQSSQERMNASNEEIAGLADSWIARHRAEALARIPLERIRFKTQLVDLRIRAALRVFMDGLGSDRVAVLAEGLMRSSAGQFKGREVRVRYRGLDRARAVAAARSALGVAEAREAVEDPRLPAPGLVVESIDGKLTLRATMDLVESELLDSRRGELAQALCAEALKA
jgi:vacuolar-type H+-ATPase subunit E/Vma4